MLDVVNPASDETIARLAIADERAVAEACQRARQAQRAWRRRPLDTRIAVARDFAAALEFEADRLAPILTREMGKPLAHARSEVMAAAARVRAIIEDLDGILERRDLGSSPIAEAITREPLGLVANISAWNYPYFVGINVFIPALLTGNAVLYKPSEHAAMTGLAIAELLEKAGLPAGLFACLIGAGPTAQALLEQDIQGAFFTGSVATGKKVAAAAAAGLYKVQLELGGKDPAYVCDDAPVEASARALVEGAFFNAGQSCCAVERIYVHEAIAKPFTAAFLEATAALRVGDPFAADTFMGPLARRAQLAVLEDQVADARDRGATLAYGSGLRRPGPGSFFEPAVLTGVDHDMRIMRDESFGPILGIQTVQGDDEARALMDDTAFGLTAGVYARSRERAEAILAELEVGTAYWNCSDRVSPHLPWSGCRSSGIGATLSREGIEAFTRPKAWHLKPPE